LSKKNAAAMPPMTMAAPTLFQNEAANFTRSAYLIQCGVSEKDLKDEGGHDLKNLVDEAVNRGLSLPAGSKEMIPRWLDEGFGLSPILWTAALIARWPRPPRSAHPL
jgi:hypothetical protein